ncbi:MGMT family protein [Mycena olivaceomarginata]|nr:MGMT family protein [Mycena olivaceomarginata]
MDSAEFHAAVYETVRLIPVHKVTSYGHIAKLIGMPNHSRHVGQALKFLTPDTNPPVPWHRVGTAGARLQGDALEAEGVEVTVTTAGERRVNFAVCGWFPEPGTV